MATSTNVQNEIKSITALQVASGVALSVSGYDSLKDAILVYSGQENGTMTILAGGFCNSTAMTKTIVAGTVYGIADLDGSRVEQTSNYITITAPSGKLWPIHLSR